MKKEVRQYWNSTIPIKPRKTQGRGILRLKKRHLKVKRVKQVPLPKLKKKLWKIISLDTRNREKQCVSCGKMGSQAGHYIKKSICNLIWQYAKINIHTQCVRCNVFLHGNPVEYRKWMVKTYGEEQVQLIEARYNSLLPLNFNPRNYITELIDKYEKLV